MCGVRGEGGGCNSYRSDPGVLAYLTVPTKGSSSEVNIKTAAMCIGFQRPDNHPKGLMTQPDTSLCGTPPHSAVLLPSHPPPIGHWSIPDLWI